MASAQYHGEPSLVVEESHLEPRDKWIELGRGAFSVVYKAFCSLHNANVAVKEIKRGNELHEIQKLVTLSSHDHVVKIKAVLEMPDGKSGIIMELCDYGLQSLRETLGSNFIPWPRCLIFMQHIVSGLQFLHHNNITHRDLKPENVMVTKLFMCKIADVGLAKGYHSQSTSGSNSQVVCPSGTPFYISPERWRNPTGVATQADDIYSCGILFYKMITNADLFYMERMAQDESFFSTLKMYVADNNYRPEMSELDKGSTPAPAIVKAVITTCWDEKPEKRKTFNYWTNLLRGEITKNYTDEMVEEADEELKQLLRNNGATVSKKKSSVRDRRPRETSGLERNPPSSSKKTADEPDSPTDMGPTVLQPLISVEEAQEGIKNVSISENDIQVIVLDGVIVTSYYGLELHGSYSLTSDTNAKELHFKLENGKRISIPSRNIYNHTVDVQSNIVYLKVWAGREYHIQPLSLSASSVIGIGRILVDITGHTDVEGKPLQTNGNFYRQPSQPMYPSHPTPAIPGHKYWHHPSVSGPTAGHTDMKGKPLETNGNFYRQPSHPFYPSHPTQAIPGQMYCHHPPVSSPASGGTSISIGYVNNFYASGHGDGLSPITSLPAPYPMNQLTDSEEMVMEDEIDESDVATHVATKYDAVSRLMNLQSESKIIRSNNRDDVVEASYKLIKAWVQRNGSDATKKELARILYKAKLYDAAKIL